jgi:hypothetical protein
MHYSEVALTRTLLLAAATLIAPLGHAAEIYYQPIIGVSAENDTNLDLDPGVHENVQGYTADFATIVGIATRDSNTTVEPRIVYRYYPDEAADNRLEGYLDFNSNYRTQRSVASIVGSIQRLDEFNAEFTSPLYNDIGPQGVPDTGKVTVGAVQNNVLLYPKYVYSLTPVMGVGVSGSYQDVTYSPTDALDHTNFEYYSGKAFLSWSVSQTADLSFGGYGSKYQATGAEATGAGVTVDLNKSWTPVFSTAASVAYQHTTFDDTTPVVLNSSVNAWGATVSADYKTQLDRFRLSAGRSISPSGGGALYNVDRVQFEYDRDLTARLSFIGAVVGLRTHALTTNIQGDDRRYAQGRIEAKWMMTPYWFLRGGYQYAYQRYETDTQSADNNRIFVQFGYQGLGQERK